MRILVTGAAGFIGFHAAEALLARGDEVVGIDNLNAYYDVKLKQARLDQLLPHKNFAFHRVDITDVEALNAVDRAGVTHILHLAAQAGVRHSLEQPQAYIDANVTGQLNILELARRCGTQPHVVYASSSSVYGRNTKVPFAVGDPVDHPISPYAATKRMGEVLAETYAYLYRYSVTGLRFFTVYGPWGRPDMAYYDFTRRILAGEPVGLFNQGHAWRDFTYIDDVVAGILAALGKPPSSVYPVAPHQIYNLGNARAERLLDFVAVLERALGRAAERELLPMQPGDVYETYADIAASRRDLGFAPLTPIAEGLPRFVAWYRAYHGV